MHGHIDYGRLFPRHAPRRAERHGDAYGDAYDRRADHQHRRCLGRPERYEYGQQHRVANDHGLEPVQPVRRHDYGERRYRLSASGDYRGQRQHRNAGQRSRSRSRAPVRTSSPLRRSSRRSPTGRSSTAPPNRATTAHRSSSSMAPARERRRTDCSSGQAGRARRSVGWRSAASAPAALRRANGGAGIVIQGAGGNVIERNFLGTDATARAGPAQSCRRHLRRQQPEQRDRGRGRRRHRQPPLRQRPIRADAQRCRHDGHDRAGTTDRAERQRVGAWQRRRRRGHLRRQPEHRSAASSTAQATSSPTTPAPACTWRPARATRSC